MFSASIREQCNGLASKLTTKEMTQLDEKVLTKTLHVFADSYVEKLLLITGTHVSAYAATYEVYVRQCSVRVTHVLAGIHPRSCLCCLSPCDLRAMALEYMQPSSRHVQHACSFNAVLVRVQNLIHSIVFGAIHVRIATEALHPMYALFTPADECICTCPGTRVTEVVSQVSSPLKTVDDILFPQTE